PPEETPYYRQQLALAHAAPTARPGPEATLLSDAAAKLHAHGAAEAERLRGNEEVEGLLDLDAPGAREFLAKLTDPAEAEATLAATPFELDHVLLAAYARNPDIAAARGQWAAAVRMYDQATYLEDVLLRYRAFTSRATPPVGAAAMHDAAFPYPGMVALK